jgi:large subunit ribosomal protein L29
MSFSDIRELRKLDAKTIEEEIGLVVKDLAYLRVKKATRQEFKPHEFRHKKRHLAHLLTLKSQNNIEQLRSK